jgi:hypothetical protein
MKVHVCHVVYTSVVYVFYKFNTSINTFSTGKYQILRVHYLSVWEGGGGWVGAGKIMEGIYFMGVKGWFKSFLRSVLGETIKFYSIN